MFCNTGDMPYKRRHCDRCGKCFTKTTFLKVHKFRHSGAKPFLQEKLGEIVDVSTLGEEKPRQNNTAAINTENLKKFLTRLFMV